MILKVYVDQMTALYKDLAESLKPKDVDHPHYQEAMDDLHFSLYNLDVLCDVLKRKQEEAEISPEEEALLLEKQFIEESVAQEPVGTDEDGEEEEEEDDDDDDDFDE